MGSVFDYSFILSLNENDYPQYLSQAYFIKTGCKLNLKHPKNINEKIQWLKLYDCIPIKTTLTDKVLVRDYVKEKIGEDFLKPVLWVGKNFNDIPFSDLPNAFIIKANHGCKWHFIIKDKENFLNNNALFEMVKIHFEGWLTQTFFGWSDFETQYKNIVPQIIIEPYLQENVNEFCEEIEVWCFNSEPKIIQKYKRLKNFSEKNVITLNDAFQPINLRFNNDDNIVSGKVDDILKNAVSLSQKLTEGFNLARIDWMIYKNKLFFEEITFTPYSGFIQFPDECSDWNVKLGKMLNLKGEKYAK